MLDDSGVASAAFWQGKIDDMGLWTTALTAAQMASIYNAGQAGKDLTQADQFQNAPPTISAQPQSQSRFVGETAALSVTAAGTGLTYQWKLNGKDIAGATNATYAIASVQTSDAGKYVVTVSNPGGKVDSLEATLTVQGGSLTSGLSGHWKFDETQGTNAADSSTFNNPGELVNFPGRQLAMDQRPGRRRFAVWRPGYPTVRARGRHAQTNEHPHRGPVGLG